MSGSARRETIAQDFTLTVELKSDRGPLDDGTITGLHPAHRTHPEILAASVASHTVPPLTVEATFQRARQTHSQLGTTP